jgi:hypothetical protein
MKHKHYDLIMAWANGAKIEAKIGGEWYDLKYPVWKEETNFRIKDECYIRYCQVKMWKDGNAYVGPAGPVEEDVDNVKLTFDHNCKLIKLEIIR